MYIRIWQKSLGSLSNSILILVITKPIKLNYGKGIIH